MKTITPQRVKYGSLFLLFSALTTLLTSCDAGNKYVSACHACHALFKDQKAMALLKEKLVSQQVELMTARLLAWANQSDWRISENKDSYAIPAAW